MLDCARHRHVGTCTRCVLVAFHKVLSLSSILSEGSDSVLNSVLWFTQIVPRIGPRQKHSIV